MRIKKEKMEFKNYASAEEIFELEKICFENHWTLDQINSHLDKYSVLKYLKDNILCAYVLYIISFDEIEILRIAVLPEKRNSNIGTTLLKRLVLEHHVKVKKIFLEVNEENISAIQFYEKNSFQKIGVRKKYYPNGKDAIQYLKEV